MWAPTEREAVLKTLALVSASTRTEMAAATAQFFVSKLEAYRADRVVEALNLCAIECRFPITLADIVQRLDDTRPGAEEAWAKFPKTEEEAGLVTYEMSVAWGVAGQLYASDPIAARMAFKESYEREVRSARAKGEPAVWRVSPGWNKASTEAVVAEALQKQLMPDEMALQYALPEHHERLLQAAGRRPALPEGKPDAKSLELVRELAAKVTR